MNNRFSSKWIYSWYRERLYIFFRSLILREKFSVLTSALQSKAERSRKQWFAQLPVYKWFNRSSSRMKLSSDIIWWKVTGFRWPFGTSLLSNCDTLMGKGIRWYWFCSSPLMVKTCLTKVRFDRKSILNKPDNLWICNYCYQLLFYRRFADCHSECDWQKISKMALTNGNRLNSTKLFSSIHPR